VFLADGQIPLITITSASNPITVYGAFGFYPSLPYGSWGLYLYTTKAALLTELNTIAGQVNNPFSYSTFLTPSDLAPPEIDVAIVTHGNTVTFQDLPYP
jgi:hypothetical protein